MFETENFDQLDSPINMKSMDKNSAIYFIDEKKKRITELYYKINKYTIAVDIFKQIRNYYEELIDLAIKYDLHLKYLYDYVIFLYQQNDYKRSLELSKILEEKFKNKSITNLTLYEIYNHIALTLFKLKKYKEAKKYYLKAIDLCQKDLNDNHNLRYILAVYYTNLGNLYAHIYRYNTSRFYHLKSIAILEEYVKKDSNKYNIFLALSYYNLGFLYIKKHKFKLAEKYLESVIKIRLKKYEGNNNLINNLYLVKSYNLICELYLKWKNDYGFKKYIKLSLNVSEIIAKINPEAYNYIFADTNLLYAKYIKKFNYEYAIGKYVIASEIYENLVKDNKIYINNLKNIYCNLIKLNKKIKDYDKSTIYKIKLHVLGVD